MQADGDLVGLATGGKVEARHGAAVGHAAFIDQNSVRIGSRARGRGSFFLFGDASTPVGDPGEGTIAIHNSRKGRNTNSDAFFNLLLVEIGYRDLIRTGQCGDSKMPVAGNAYATDASLRKSPTQVGGGWQSVTLADTRNLRGATGTEGSAPSLLAAAEPPDRLRRLTVFETGNREQQVFPIRDAGHPLETRPLQFVLIRVNNPVY